MKYLLATAGKAALLRFAQPHTLLALDYDGTLASIVDNPKAAHMRACTRRLLTQTAQHYPTVVITGRARNDVRRFLAGIAPVEVIGNHGLEGPGTMTGKFLQRVAGWRSQLAGRLGSTPGLVLEDKRHSLSIHYRRCKNPSVARTAVLNAAAGLGGARLIGGKAVVSLVPEEAPHKGAALLSALTRSGCKRAIYVGDDDTDEDVFALERPDEILSVRVGRRQDSQAAYYLRDQSEIDILLQILLSGGSDDHEAAPRTAGQTRKRKPRR